MMQAQGALDRRFEAVVVDVAVLEAEKGALLEAALESAAAVGLHVVVLTDRNGQLDDALRHLARRGITGSLILLACREPGLIDRPDLARAVRLTEGTTVLQAIEDQVQRRREGRTPAIDDDAAWVVHLPVDASQERVAEAIGALADGRVGLRGSREEDGSRTQPLFVASGVYDDGDPPRLLEGPVWIDLAIEGGGRGGRRLDLRTGVLVRDDPDSGCSSFRFLSATGRAAGALRAEAPADLLRAGGPFGDGADLERHRVGGSELARSTVPGGGGIVVAVDDRWRLAAGRRSVERIAAWAADPTTSPSWEDAVDRLEAASGAGFDRLLEEHRAAWADRWQLAGVDIGGSDADQLDARFSVFHLLGAAAGGGEAAVGPRGLTGTAYGGHVFWDADVYVLPALAALAPAAARAMLEYRIRRLPAARHMARAQGREGARFPWESARTGVDVTPSVGRRPGGELVPIRTGPQEEHIVADVAWAAAEYAAWTGDIAFLEGTGRDLLVETARYWASRIRVDHDGTGHILGVMGPDEYHEVVDDNTYTNVLARWNLRRGADLLERTGGDGTLAARWRDLAACLVDGWDGRRGAHEQFAGYWGLEHLLAEDIAPRPFTADLLLGAERVAGSQLIKQADVMLLHHMVPDEVTNGSLAGDLAFYEPRTAHGSSLSPAVHAGLFARAGDPDRGLELFRMAARIDLDDLTGTAGGGLHLATMGGAWQALAYGFLGLRPRPDHLEVAPSLPASWRSLEIGVAFHGRRVRVRAERGGVEVRCEEPVRVRVGRGPVQDCRPPGRTFEVDDPPPGRRAR